MARYSKEINDLTLATDMIKDFMLACYDDLIKLEGSENVFSAISLYSFNGGFAASINIKNRLGINDNSSKSVALVWAFLHNAFRRKPEVVIGPNHCILFVKRCSHLSAGPEICMLECVSIAKGVASSFESELDFDMTSSIADRDDCCTHIFKSKSVSSSKVMMDINNKRLEDDSFLIADEEALAYYRAYLSELWLYVIKASVDLIGGEKTLNLFKERMYKQGVKWGSLLYRELSNSSNKDLVISEFIGTINSLLQQKGGEIVNLNRRSYREIEICPFSSAPPETCKLIEAFVNGAIATIDAGYHFAYQKTMNAGNVSCIWTLGQDRI
jgi:hypothetical protein